MIMMHPFPGDVERSQAEKMGRLAEVLEMNRNQI